MRKKNFYINPTKFELFKIKNQDVPDFVESDFTEFNYLMSISKAISNYEDEGYQFFIINYNIDRDIEESLTKLNLFLLKIELLTYTYIVKDKKNNRILIYMLVKSLLGENKLLLDNYKLLFFNLYNEMLNIKEIKLKKNRIMYFFYLMKDYDIENHCYYATPYSSRRCGLSYMVDPSHYYDSEGVSSEELIDLNFFLFDDSKLLSLKERSYLSIINLWSLYMLYNRIYYNKDDGKLYKKEVSFKKEEVFYDNMELTLYRKVLASEKEERTRLFKERHGVDNELQIVKEIEENGKSYLIVLSGPYIEEWDYLYYSELDFLKTDISFIYSSLCIKYPQQVGGVDLKMLLKEDIVLAYNKLLESVELFLPSFRDEKNSIELSGLKILPIRS
jgi:hypothetical protein